MTPHGDQRVQGFIDPSVLSNQDRTQLLDQPVESFYNHFERPINKKIQEMADQEWSMGETGKNYLITPDIMPIEIKE